MNSKNTKINLTSYNYIDNNNNINNDNNVNNDIIKKTDINILKNKYYSFFNTDESKFYMFVSHNSKILFTILFYILCDKFRKETGLKPNIIIDTNQITEIIDIGNFLNDNSDTNVNFIIPKKNLEFNDEYKKIIKNNTCLFSCKYSNSDIGNIINIPNIGENFHKNKIPIHVDISNIIKYFRIDLSISNIDILTFSLKKLIKSDLYVCIINKDLMKGYGITNDVFDFTSIKLNNKEHYSLLNEYRQICKERFEKRSERNSKLIKFKKTFLENLNKHMTQINYHDIYKNNYDKNKFNYIKFETKKMIPGILTISIIKDGIIPFSNKSLVNELKINNIYVNKYFGHQKKYSAYIKAPIIFSLVGFSDIIKRGIITFIFDDNFKISNIKKIIRIMMKNITKQFKDITKK